MQFTKEEITAAIKQLQSDYKICREFALIKVDAKQRAEYVVKAEALAKRLDEVKAMQAGAQ